MLFVKPKGNSETEILVLSITIKRSTKMFCWNFWKFAELINQKPENNMESKKLPPYKFLGWKETREIYNKYKLWDSYWLKEKYPKIWQEREKQKKK